uniref:(northern house mosquito) hypothetical protein n=1 Tax=Culex pipiens TaxID=7175 RepID=A0A8D8IZD0_CULPI
MIVEQTSDCQKVQPSPYVAAIFVWLALDECCNPPRRVLRATTNKRQSATDASAEENINNASRIPPHEKGNPSDDDDGGDVSVRVFFPLNCLFFSRICVA